MSSTETADTSHLPLDRWTVAIEGAPEAVSVRRDRHQWTLGLPAGDPAPDALRRAIGQALMEATRRPEALPVRARIPVGESALRAVLESRGLTHLPEADHEAKGVAWQVLEAPVVRSFSSLTDRARAQILDLWVAVNDDGGAVGFTPFAPRADVEAALRRHEEDLAGGDLSGVALQAPEGGLLALGFVRGTTHPLRRHVVNLERLMVTPTRRGQFLGAQLLAAMEAEGVRRGAELATLDYRGGLGLGAFYRACGWTEIGRLPGAIRVAVSDDRDQVFLARNLLA